MTPALKLDGESENEFEFEPAFSLINGTVSFTGAGASVKIGTGNRADNLRIVAGSGARIEIGSECNLGQLSIYAFDGATVRVGSGVGFSADASLMSHEPKTITIGDGCLISGGLYVSTSDMHALFDSEGRLINEGRDIHVGSRVWICQHVHLLKGANVGDGCVIGARSLVSGYVPEKSMAAGNPAKVLRRDITWSHENPAAVQMMMA